MSIINSDYVELLEAAEDVLKFFGAPGAFSHRPDVQRLQASVDFLRTQDTPPSSDAKTSRFQFKGEPMDGNGMDMSDVSDLSDKEKGGDA